MKLGKCGKYGWVEKENDVCVLMEMEMEDE